MFGFPVPAELPSLQQDGLKLALARHFWPGLTCGTASGSAPSKGRTLTTCVRSILGARTAASRLVPSTGFSCPEAVTLLD